jgi:hypothetical protein
VNNNSEGYVMKASNAKTQTFVDVHQVIVSETVGRRLMVRLQGAQEAFKVVGVNHGDGITDDATGKRYSYADFPIVHFL